MVDFCLGFVVVEVGVGLLCDFWWFSFGFVVVEVKVGGLFMWFFMEKEGWFAAFVVILAVVWRFHFGRVVTVKVWWLE